VTRIGREGNLLPFPTDQDFQVWFRIAGFPRFNKLYRVVVAVFAWQANAQRCLGQMNGGCLQVINDRDLKAGDILRVQVQNKYNNAFALEISK